MKPAEVLAENCDIRTSSLAIQEVAEVSPVYTVLQFPAFARNNKYSP